MLPELSRKDEVIAHLLVTEGFSSLNEIAMVSMEELTSIEGFDEDIANELINRANNFVKIEAQRIDDKLKQLEVKDVSRISKTLVLHIN